MIINNRNIYKILLLLSCVVIIGVVLTGIGAVLSYFNTGADRATLLQIPLKKQAAYMPKVAWIDTINPARPIEKQTLKSIQRDYINAWFVKHKAYQTYKASLLDDYYTTQAKIPITHTIAYNQSTATTLQSTTTDHELLLDFYSADGQLAVLTDQNVVTYQHVKQADQIVAQTRSISDYQVLMLLEDGFWRVRHCIKTKSNIFEPSPTTTPFYPVQDSTLFVADQPYTIKGINYYPQQTPWDTFGEGFDIAVIRRDFELLRQKGLNTLRIFVSYEDFGKEHIAPRKLEKLAKLLDEAEAQDLKIIVTLFDFYGDYSMADWTFTHRHIEQLVGTFKNHKAIMAWDVKNEPDLDFKNRGRENVLAWLEAAITQIRKYDPHHLITIGWAKITSATLLQNQLDLLSFHYYDDIAHFQKAYDTLLAQTDKPLVLQEYGLPSSRGLWDPFGATEQQQANYYQQFQQLITKNQLHSLPWTLYDFKQVPSAVIGRLPWRKHKQKHFGFIDVHGQPKAAFQYIGDVPLSSESSSM